VKVFCSPYDGKNGSSAVRCLLAAAYNEMYASSLPQIEKTSFGKPYFPSKPEVCFSLSHTKTHVMCALGGAAVGVDVEVARKPSQGVIHRVCLPEELETLDFMALWTLKESYVKCIGDNRVSMRSIVFRGTRGHILPPDAALYCRVYDTVPGCTAAICSYEANLPGSIYFLSI